MRFKIILVLLFFACRLSAQRLNGTVLDHGTKKPIANATVFSKKSATYTSETGNFSLVNTRVGDTITVMCMGYKTYKFVAGNGQQFTTLIYMEPDNILLDEVLVKGKRNYKQDSINKLREFAAVLGYRPPGIKSIFVTRSPYVNTGRPNNTSELAGINILQVFRLFNRNNNTSRLQKDILNDEQNDYIDRMFSKEKITELTKLKGDSLRDFMIRYRPQVNMVRITGEYDMMMYIKKSYADFIKPSTKK